MGQLRRVAPLASQTHPRPGALVSAEVREFVYPLQSAKLHILKRVTQKAIPLRVSYVASGIQQKVPHADSSSTTAPSLFHALRRNLVLHDPYYELLFSLGKKHRKSSWYLQKSAIYGNINPSNCSPAHTIRNPTTFGVPPNPNSCFMDRCIVHPECILPH